MASDVTRFNIQTIDGVTIAKFIDNRILDEAGYKRGSDGYRVGPDGKTIFFVKNSCYQKSGF